MKLQVEQSIQASAKDVWGVITDIENSANFISGIEEVKILDHPTEGLVGLKWHETRTLFGQTATEIMWVTEAVENEYYKVHPESHGAIYLTNFFITENNGKSTLKMEFSGEPQTFGAKVMSALTGFMFKKATKDALIKDLDDIKAAVENSVE
ncbi:MAG: SRPBCC family protein [Anaerolineales bacterium]|nr:SRPBCC family protein [Anaerolineales bacterium]